MHFTLCFSLPLLLLPPSLPPLSCIWQVNEIAITIHQVSLDYFTISRGGVRLRSSSSWKGVATSVVCLLLCPPSLPPRLVGKFALFPIFSCRTASGHKMASTAAAPVGTAPASASVSAKWVATAAASSVRLVVYCTAALRLPHKSPFLVRRSDLSKVPLPAVAAHFRFLRLHISEIRLGNSLCS